MTISSDSSAFREESRDKKTGRFGEWRHSEGGLALDDVSETDLEHARAAEVMHLAGTAARRYRGAFDHLRTLSHEDIGQEVVAEYWTLHRSGKQPSNLRQWVNRVTYIQLNKRGTVSHGATRAGLKRLKEWEDTYRAEHDGRTPSSSERNTAAEEIRESFPPQQRPWRDYQHLASESLASTENLLAAAEHAHTDDDEEGAGQVVPDSWSDAALSLRGGDASQQRQCKRVLAAALCEQRNAPMPLLGNASTTTAGRWRSILANHPGGVSGAISAWKTGEDTPRATEALFGPWGRDLSIREQSQVIDLLDSTKGAADSIWDSARLFTDRANTPSILAALGSGNH